MNSDLAVLPSPAPDGFDECEDIEDAAAHGFAPDPGGLLQAWPDAGLARLREHDPQLLRLLQAEYTRQHECLSMVASSSMADPSVLFCEGTVLGNVTAEGYPGGRYHGGCGVVDEIESLAIARAMQAFGARFANVQPHSGSSANEAILFAAMKPDDCVMGLDLDAGGHLTHGSRASVSGQYFRAVAYGLDADGRIDYPQVRRLAHEHRPRVIVCGASAYPRVIDFAAFRAIADEVGAILLADISHIAGLVVAGLHPSPIDHAHFTTTSTYKQLFGPRGGLILCGKDHDRPLPGMERTAAQLAQRGVFPLTQGTPNMGAIAAKARALAAVCEPDFKAAAQRIVHGAAAMASEFRRLGYRVLTGGTDNHMVLVDVASRGLTGAAAQAALEACNVIVNKNRIPGDRHPPLVASGVRIGTNQLALRGMDAEAMAGCVRLLDRVWMAMDMHGDTDWKLPSAVRAQVREQVRRLCAAHPIPAYPLPPPARPRRAA